MILSLLSSELAKLPDSSEEVLLEESAVAKIEKQPDYSIADLRVLASAHQRVYEATRAMTGVNLRNIEAELRKAQFFTLLDSGDDFI